MLRVKGRPENLGSHEGGAEDWQRKRAIFEGTFDPIRRVSLQRLQGGKRQLPHDKTELGDYRVKVTYGIDHEGFLTIESVFVLFGRTSSGRWSCFYDIDTRFGEMKKGVNNAFTYFFLELKDVDQLEEVIREYEERQVVRQLARRGPVLFDDLDPVDVSEEVAVAQQCGGDTSNRLPDEDG